MIDLRNGKKISDVVISTALGHGGSGMFPYNLLPGYRSLMRAARKTGTTIFSKSATRHKRIGNFILEDPRTWKYVQRIRGSFNGMLNAYGLTNEGAAIEAQKIYRAREGGFSVIPNFFSEFAKGKSVAIRETLEAIEIYARVLGNQFSAVELNYSCPNSGCEIRANMENCADCTSEVKKAFPWLFVIAKIAYDHPFEFAYQQQLAGVDAIHAINTIRYQVVFNKPSPFGKKGGGVSGGPAKRRAMEYNKELPKWVSVPLIFGCGVENPLDVGRYQDMGGSAVSICSLAIRRPRTARFVVEQFNG